MKILTQKRCYIGEGPIWNEREEKLYFSNGKMREICVYDFQSDRLMIRNVPVWAAAVAFTKNNGLILSHTRGVHIVDGKGALLPLYNEEMHSIKYAGDMKVGPDGAIYVGTLSEKIRGVSDNADGVLYRISPHGQVKILLRGLELSNGLDWSIDEKKFYHADTGVSRIREYFFDKETGEIEFSGRQVCVEGVDGLTMGTDGCLYVSCAWKKYIAIIDCETLTVKDYILFEDTFPMSCGFCGKNMDILAVTTASDTADLDKDANAGFTVLAKQPIKGRKPYLFSRAL